MAPSSLAVDWDIFPAPGPEGGLLCEEGRRTWVLWEGRPLPSLGIPRDWAGQHFDIDGTPMRRREHLSTPHFILPFPRQNPTLQRGGPGSSPQLGGSALGSRGSSEPLPMRGVTASLHEAAGLFGSLN